MLVALALLLTEPTIDKPRIAGPLRAKSEVKTAPKEKPIETAPISVPFSVPAMKESKPIPPVPVANPVNTDAFDPLYIRKTEPIPIVPDTVQDEIDKLITEQATENHTNEKPQEFEGMKVSFKSKIDPEIAKSILQKDINDLSSRLLGHWDSDLQTFFEPELKLANSDMHPRLHVKIISTKFENSENAFIVEYRKGGEAGEVLRNRIWTLSPSPLEMSIILKSYEPKANIKLSDSLSYKLSDFNYVSGCDIILKRRGDNFSGDTQAGKCKLNLNNKIINVSEHHEIGAKNWDVSDIGVDNQGIRAFGNIDGAPTNLKKANMFSCWISYYDNKDTKFATDLKLHDQGGVAKYSFGNQTIGIRLRNIEWPYGTNRPSLTLYLLQNNNDVAPFYTWTNPDNNRIALSYNQYQASCTRD